MRINVKSVIKAGLAAGIVINIMGCALIPVIGNEMNTVLKTRSLPPLGPVAMIYFPLWSLILGICIVLIYAFIRHAFHSKMQAAIAVALAVWFLSYFSSNAALVAYGFMPLRLVVIGTTWGLIELFAASAVGACFYRDRI